VLQDGLYTWVVEATAPNRRDRQVTGTLTIAQAVRCLPERAVSASPRRFFTLNRDGLSDRVTINVNLRKTSPSLTLY